MEEKISTENKSGRKPISVAIIGGAIIAILLILSTVWINWSGQKATEEAVHSVSSVYLRELTDRREQGIASRINDHVDKIKTTLKILTPNDLQSVENLSAYLKKMTTVYDVDCFAFVDLNGQIFTPEGPASGDKYLIKQEVIAEPKVFTQGKQVAIAVPVENITFQGVPIKVCFIQADVTALLKEILLQTTTSELTVFNLYQKNGDSLTDSTRLIGGTNILEALNDAIFDANSSKEQVVFDFANSRGGMASFTFNDEKMSIFYRPVENTGWMLSYLIHENKLEDEISAVNLKIARQNLVQMFLTGAAMLLVFALIISQARKNSQLVHEQKLAEAENRIKNTEMEEKFRLQTKLLSEERRRRRQSEMIQALTADYRLVYHLNLDSDEAVCYRVAPEVSEKLNRRDSDVVRFAEAIKNYAKTYVVPVDREKFLEFVKPENIRARLRESEMVSFRYLMTHNGEEHFMLIRIARIDDGLHAVGVGFANVDDQIREEMERNQKLSDALAQAQHANIAKTTFLSNMSHDIRTPMNAIIGFTTMALRHFDNRTQVKDSLEKVLTSSNHLLGLINDILDMSRIESGRVEVAEQECNLSDLIHNLIHIIQPQITAKQQKFRIDAFKIKNEDVFADQLKINQVLINILSNAVKYTPSTGSIFFRISQYESEVPGYARYEFRIKDNGMGMSKEFLKHVFDPFEREETSTKSGIQGTGLGMSITKKMVELMGGDIQVESEKDKGSEFIVNLDLKLQQNVKPVSIQELNGLRVLIVDDDFNTCESVTDMLKQMGMRSEWTTSPREAVFRAGRALDEDPFSAYVIDWLMPEQNGIETVRQIRRVVGMTAPVIILTAYEYSDIEQEARAAGVTTFCTKPLFMSDLKNALSRAINGQEDKNKADDLSATNLEGKRVMLVEDIEVNREIAKAILTEIGLEVDDADDGTVAVEKFRDAPLNHYDLILMDVQMPKMNGYEATRAIRALSREDAHTVPIVAMTANAFEEDKDNALKAGMNDHLAKPLDIPKLLATLTKYLK